MDYQNYLTPEQAQKLAEMGDPNDQIDALSGLQGMANGMRVRGLPERSNGRVWGATSPVEAAGGIAQNLAGAYMNKSLSDQYGDILKQGNKNRGTAAGMIVNALRKAKQGGAYGATGLSMNDDGTIEVPEGSGW